MRQLELFAGYPTAPTTQPAAPESEPPIELPDVLPGQVGLFEPRSLLLGRARAAVAQAELDEACATFETLRGRCPDDVAIAREALETRSLRDRLARIEAPRARRREHALLAFANELAMSAEPRASLRRRLLTRIAAEIRRQHGDEGELEGKLAGEYLLDAGEIEVAQASLAQAFAVRRDARSLFRLADATLLLGYVGAARRSYLEALLHDPFDPALGTVRDEEVRALPARAHYELEIEDEPEAWSAPAGILEGVFPRLSPAEVQAVLPPPDGLAPGRRRALEGARAFVEALAVSGSAHGGAAIEIRRTMKRLSPQLFRLYMDRVVRGSAS
jgi:tetratricopeptide (TPR) repeat protein